MGQLISLVAPFAVLFIYSNRIDGVAQRLGSYFVYIHVFVCISFSSVIKPLFSAESRWEKNTQVECFHQCKNGLNTLWCEPHLRKNVKVNKHKVHGKVHPNVNSHKTEKKITDDKIDFTTNCCLRAVINNKIEIERALHHKIHEDEDDDDWK